MTQHPTTGGRFERDAKGNLAPIADADAPVDTDTAAPEEAPTQTKKGSRK